MAIGLIQPILANTSAQQSFYDLMNLMLSYDFMYTVLNKS
jgi:hypothetical protein